MLYIATTNAPLRREKGTVYEGGIREPLIVKWPGKIEPGILNGSIISSVDFYPTFLDFAGIEPPAKQVLDGQSIKRILLNNDEVYDRAIFWHYPVYHHDVPASAVRKGDYKLNENLVDGSVQLYNIAEDISESRDLSASNQEKMNELYNILKTWQKDVKAEFPAKNPDFDPERRYEWGRHPDSK